VTIGPGADAVLCPCHSAGLGAAARWKRSLGASARMHEDATSSVHTWLLGSTGKAPKGSSLSDLVYGSYEGG